MKKDTFKKNPLISVVVATYNPKRTIQKCIDSIFDQTYDNIEILVIDAVTYPQEKRKEYAPIIKKNARYFLDGPERSRQRNRGIWEAKGEYILIIDQDMYLTKNVVKECYKTLTKSNDIALVIPEISIGQGYWTACVALERYVTTYLEESMNECCRFFRKKDALNIGGYDTTIVGVEDSDFHYRMKAKGKIGKIKSYMYHDEGKIEFWGRVKKKYYYSRAFREYLRRYPNVATAQFFPIKKAYFKHWKILFRTPSLITGIFFLRSAEVVAGFLGMLTSKRYE